MDKDYEEGQKMLNEMIKELDSSNDVVAKPDASIPDTKEKPTEDDIDYDNITPEQYAKLDKKTQEEKYWT